ncbi:MAG: hypothetical protein ACREDU_00315 [Methylocella sp.]
MVKRLLAVLRLLLVVGSAYGVQRSGVNLLKLSVYGHPRRLRQIQNNSRTTELAGGGTSRAETVRIAKQVHATFYVMRAFSTAPSTASRRNGSTCLPVIAFASRRMTG